MQAGFTAVESSAHRPAVIHVAVAAVFNSAGELLVTLRPPHVDQGNLWEFPGGKVEPGEDARQALSREIEEEVGLRIVRARPLIRVRHDYPAKSVLLDVWRVTEYSGQARGREGQRLAWRAPRSLNPAHFPAANHPIIRAVGLPPLYLVTPEPRRPYADFFARLERLLDAGIRLAQFRAKTLGDADFRALAADVVAICRARGARVLLNGPPEQCLALGADGVHLSSERLLRLNGRPLPPDRLVAASCHDRQQVDQAGRIGADFIAISPVRPTRSHPGARPLGWDGLHALVEPAVAPVYGLGGLAVADLPAAWRHGAQGIAAIRSLWEAPDPEDVIRAGGAD